jgi:hypothetical protein
MEEAERRGAERSEGAARVLPPPVRGERKGRAARRGRAALTPRRVAHESDGVGRRERCSAAARVPGERHGGMRGRRVQRRGHRGEPARVGSSCR